jgi:Kef-type K+ transport system membrane component KefB
MFEPFTHAAIWLSLAVICVVVADHLKVSVALIEICAGVGAAAIVRHFWGASVLPTDEEWLKFLASAGAVLLTFLAGAELEPDVIKRKLREISIVGLVGFLVPFLGCAFLARYALGWSGRASLLAGVALSTTSMAVVYAVLLETGFNRTEYGKGILGACFVNDLGTVIALGLLFAPFSYKTVIFLSACIILLVLLPFVTRILEQRYAHRTAAIRTKWIVFVLFALGALAIWSGSEAVLPAYLVGIVLAEFMNEDAHLMRRLRTLTIGFLTPFYFLRAGALVDLPAVISGLVVFLALFAGKVASKIFGLYPVIRAFCHERRERWFYTLLMSTGLTFGTISALYGLTHGIVTRQQYSLLVTIVIASAVIPTLIAVKAFLPGHLLPRVESALEGSSGEPVIGQGIYALKQEEDLGEE